MTRRRDWLRVGVALGLAGTALLLAGPVRAAEVAPRTLGSPEAPVKITEYASLTCPHCANFHKSTLPELKKRYIDTGKVQLTYRDFPLDQIALKAAVVAHCAGPERYFQFLDAFFANQERWAYANDPVQALKQIVRLGGLDESRVDACLADKAMEEAVLKSRLDAQKDYQIRSTPSFVIDGKVYAGSHDIDEMAKAIDPLLVAGGTAPAPATSAPAATAAPPAPAPVAPAPAAPTEPQGLLARAWQWLASLFD